MARSTTLSDTSLSVTSHAAGQWFFSGHSSFLHQYSWPPWYNWNIVESGVKHYKPTI